MARGLLLHGPLFVHLDPREDGVELPDSLSDEPHVMLQVGLDLPVPIPDLRVDRRGISGTLSFARSPFRCVVPWSAVYAICGEDGRGMVWPDSMPLEVEDEVLRELGRKEPLGLRLLEGGAAAQPSAEEPDDCIDWDSVPPPPEDANSTWEPVDAVASPAKPSHLRLVK
ncbi:MAG: hypothetical protein AB8H86_32140 [Polyangiales bacterium]